MRNLSFLLFLSVFCTSFNVLSQKKTDIGLLGGASYYLGDLNKEQLFFQPSYSFGGLCRFNITDRYSLRVSAYYLSLKGSSVTDEFPQFMTLETSFNKTFVDAEFHFEFNFLPYTPTKMTYTEKKKSKFIYTPYVTGGVGYCTSISGGSSFFTIPFGVGLKFNITERLSAGAEWLIHKTFTDDIDNLSHETIIESQHSFIHNNDWYSISSLFITYKFFKFAEQCPVYN